jgi:hypothetical protein
VALPLGSKSSVDVSSAIVNILRGRTVVFLGDSMATQTFQAFACFLHSTVEVYIAFVLKFTIVMISLQSPVSYHLQFQFARIYGTSNCPYGSKHCELVGECTWAHLLKVSTLSFNDRWMHSVLQSEDRGVSAKESATRTDQIRQR